MSARLLMSARNTEEACQESSEATSLYYLAISLFS